MADVNEICRECIRWQKHGKECWVHWEGKKECSIRALREDEIMQFTPMF